MRAGCGISQGDREQRLVDKNAIATSKEIILLRHNQFVCENTCNFKWKTGEACWLYFFNCAEVLARRDRVTENTEKINVQ